MLKRLGQYLALIAMMAAAVNAQCALSCSLLSPGSESFPATAGVQSGGHRCCRHQNAPKPKHEPNEAPCPQPAAPVAEVRSGGSGNATPLATADAGFVTVANRVHPFLADIQLGVQVSPDASPRSIPRLISVLRI
jgi:hypothetical protein